jgi:hypothetical protein
LIEARLEGETLKICLGGSGSLDIQRKIPVRHTVYL